ncbi:unnamed protein product [Paramecium sonneborni]|uniref:EGF-like domain-containing protein n=1 Tax=Paramecium sonneborni TaxID=65129 RepID=A0A8S1QXJ6_9CILI|nr:unnamed protein product [Paramecium sonneborni]
MTQISNAKYRDGTCINYQSCNQTHQSRVQNYCKDLDDETPYSQLLIKEDLNQFELDYYPEYTLMFQTGENFLKGFDRYFSFWEGQRILGGQFIWAQARFRRVHQNLGPHHSISIGFYVLFGPSFQSNGQFIYQIDQQPAFYTSALHALYSIYGPKYQIIRKKVDHSLNNLTLELECFGANNEVTQAYCGFYNYYLAIHYCQPFCLSCKDEKTCTSWNSTYNSNLIQFSSTECLSNQYFDEYKLQCLNCEPLCPTCKSKRVCLTCLNPTYTLTSFGCFCKQNQYEESNQCQNCPIQCNQCLSYTYCTECLSKNNRKLSNGQCLCTDGYYQKDQNIMCSLCDKLCGTCFGPTSNDCLTCNGEIFKIELVNSTCQCPTNYFYQNSGNKCTICHSTCLTCFKGSIDGCLSCDSQQNRSLKGLNCKCTTGFYTNDDDICIQCPNDQDVSLLECYKYCDDGDLIWNTDPCNKCGQGFTLISNECIPIFGDLQVVGYEQCDDGNSISYDKCYNCQFQCPINCQSCDINTILPCSDICGDGLVTGDEECEDGNDIQFDGCFNCKYQCQNECTKCIKGKCFECATLGWQIDISSQSWLCKEICGDGLQVGIEECDDANFNDFDGCFNCKFLCRIGCSQCDYELRKCLSCEFHGFEPYEYYCQPILNDGLLVYDPYGFYYEKSHTNIRCDQNCNFKCQLLECNSCINNKCQACISGQNLSSNNICQPICGDNIKAENEQCEDFQILPYRGCQNCKKKCQDYCSKCDTRGRGCFECKEGYKLIDFLCYSQCGNFLITYDKECDDGNLIPDDGCHFCQLNCQSSCQICIQGTCHDCQEGYQLIQSKCFAIINSYEQYKYSNDVECLLLNMKTIMKHNNYGWNQIILLNRIFLVNSVLLIVKYLLMNLVQAVNKNIIQMKNKNFNLSAVMEQSELNNKYCFNYSYIHLQYCLNPLDYNRIMCINGYYFDEIKSCGNSFQGFCQGYLIEQQLSIQKKSYISQLGDAFMTHDEECNVGNLLIYDGCHECKQSCPKNCRVSQFGKCLECKSQYLLLEGQCLDITENIENTMVEKRKCFDLFLNSRQYITIFENQFQSIHHNNNILSLCYFDLNLIRVFGYQNHQLKLDQVNNCKVQQLVKCLECQDGYELDFHKKYCIPKCQDGIQLLQEECDDENLIQFDGCYKCQKSCQIECLFCSDNKCYICKEGWQLQEYQCKQICGDGLLAVLSNEQCDNPDDFNCADCKYQCDHNCLVCDKFQNCEQCLLTFETRDGQCIPICGDNIITPFYEQCDDGNDIPYDGCFECQFQCSFGCIKCEMNNYCVKCEDQYFILDTHTNKCQELKQIIDSEPESESEQEVNDDDLLILQCNENYDFINNQCVNLCGNGRLNSNFEQCDDGNNYGGDGCSALCFEEDSFKCINQENSPSLCTFIHEPTFNLILLSDKSNHNKIVELSFSQEVYILGDNLFENVVEIMIIPQAKFEQTIVPLLNFTSQLNNPHYQIYIQFLEPVKEPILQIKIQKFCIYNQFNFDLSTNFKSISLGTPFVLSTSAQKKVNQIINMNEAVVYSTISFAGILVLTDLLQALSYIKYMQYRFPPHFSQFLETYTKISLQPILDCLKVDEIIAELNGGTIPYQKKKSQQSIQVDVMNQLYLMNAKGCYFSYLASLLTYFICYFLSSIKFSQWLGRRFEKNKDSMKILRFISIFQKKIQAKCSKVKNYYFSLGIYQLFYSTLHQLLFSTLLQFPEYTFNSIFEIINSIAAFISLQFLIYIFVSLLSITSSQIQDKQKWRYFFQDTKTQFWARNFKPFQIYKTIFYITIIVKFIEYPEAQSVLLSMQSLFYLIYLIHFRPIMSNFELAKLFCREIVFLIMTGSFLVYSLELNEDQFMLFGWLHMALFCFMLGFTLIVDILEQGKQAYNYRLRKIQKKEKNANQKCIGNSDVTLKKKK